MPIPDFAVPYAAPAQPKIMAAAMPPCVLDQHFSSSYRRDDAAARLTMAKKGANLGVSGLPVSAMLAMDAGLRIGIRRMRVSGLRQGWWRIEWCCTEAV